MASFISNEFTCHKGVKIDTAVWVGCKEAPSLTGRQVQHTLLPSCVPLGLLSSVPEMLEVPVCFKKLNSCIFMQDSSTVENSFDSANDQVIYLASASDQLPVLYYYHDADY